MVETLDKPVNRKPDLIRGRQGRQPNASYRSNNTNALPLVARLLEKISAPGSQ